LKEGFKMAIHHDGQIKPDEKVVSIEPVVLTNVVVKTIEKTVVNANIVQAEVEVEKPVFIDKEYERPIIIDKEYERPVAIDKEYERPVVKNVDCERPVIIDKEYERPVLIEKEYEKPVLIEKQYDIPVTRTVPYDLPIVSMEKVKEAAQSAVSVITEAALAVVELKETVRLLKETVDEIKNKLPEEIKMPKIVHEEVVVKDVKIIEDTVHVIGKIIARGA